MSGTGQDGTQTGGQSIGVLMKRMTLSNLGLDAMEDVDAQSMDALSGAEALAQRVSGGSRRIGAVDERIGVLPGMPSFLREVQERYVPLNVDTDFGRVFEMDGPRSATDLGPWQNWLHAILLMLFDEDEALDAEAMPGWRRDVRPEQIRQAVAKQASARPQDVREMLEKMPPAVRQVAEQRIAEARARVEKERRADFLSISDAESTSLFGRSRDRAERFERALASGEMSASIASPSSAFGSGLNSGLNSALDPALLERLDTSDPAFSITEGAFVEAGLVGEALELGDLTLLDGAPSPLAALSRSISRSTQGRSRRALANTPGIGSMRRASFSERVAARATFGMGTQRRAGVMAGPGETGQEDAAGRMMVGMRGVRPVLSESALAFGEAERFQTGAAAGGSYDGYGSSASYNVGLPGSLLAIIPERVEPEVLASVHYGGAPQRAGASSLFGGSTSEDRGAQRNYPRRMGRAGALISPRSASLSQGRGAAPRTSPQRRLAGTASSSALDGVRGRLRALMQAPSRAAQQLQHLADEPTTRLLGALTEADASAPGSRASRGSAGVSPALGDRPFMPSSLGFSASDNFASMQTELRTMSQLGELPGLVDRYAARAQSTGRFDFGSPGELVRSIAEGGELDAETARQIAAFAAQERMQGRVNDAQMAQIETLLGQQGGAEPPALPRSVMSILESAVSPEQIMARLVALPEGTLSALPEPVRRAVGRQRARASRADSMGLVSSGEESREVRSIRATLQRLGLRDVSQLSQLSPEALESALATSRTTSAPPVLMGDVSLSSGYVPGLASSLRSLSAVDARWSEPGRMPGVLTQASQGDEPMMGRLDKMLSLIQVGDGEAAELRASFAAMRASGSVSASSRLAWMGETPVLVSGREPGAEVQTSSFDLRRAIETGLTPAQVESIQRSGASVMSLSQVIPGLSASQAQRAQSQRAQRGAEQTSEGVSLEQALRDRFGGSSMSTPSGRLLEGLRAGDVGRMMSFGKAASVLLPQLVETGGDPQVMRELQRSLLGSVDARTRAGGELSGAESASGLVERLMRGGEVVETSRGFGLDRVALSLRGVSPEARRNALSLRGGDALSQGGPALDARVDVPRAAGVGQTSTFMPGVAQSSRFAEMVERELGGIAPSPAGLEATLMSPMTPRLASISDEALAPSVGWSSEGDLVRVSLSPGALSQAAGLEGASIAASPQAPREMQAVGRVLEEAVRRPGASPVTIARELQTRLPSLNISAPQMPTLSRRLAERPQAASEAVQMISRAVRAMTQREAPERAVESGALSGPAYFERLVPTAFRSGGPEALLSASFEGGALGAFAETVSEGLPMRGGLASRMASSAGAFSSGSLVELPRFSAAPDGASAELVSTPRAQWGGVVELPREVRREIGGRSGYAMVEPTQLSPVLRRLSGATSSPLSSAPSWEGGAGASGALVQMPTSEGGPSATGRVASRSDGQPGSLGAVLERFVPSGVVASRRTAANVSGGVRTPSGDLLSTSAFSRGSLVSGEASMSALTPAFQERLRAQAEEAVAEVSRGEALVMPGGEAASLGDLYELGSGMAMVRQVDRLEDPQILNRIETLLDRAESMTDRPQKMRGASDDMAVVRHTPSKPDDPYQGMPAWRRRDEHVQGVQVDELREMLRQVGAMPIQGGEMASMRDFVNPFLGQQSEPESAPDPLFSAGMAGDSASSGAGATSPTGSLGIQTHDLEQLVEQVYPIVMKRLEEALNQFSYD